MIYLMHKSAKFGLVLTVTYLQIYIHYLTVTLSNLDPEPLNEWNWNSAAHPILIELLSGSIGWGAGLQTSRLVQSKGSNPLKVL